MLPSSASPSSRLARICSQSTLVSEQDNYSTHIVIGKFWTHSLSDRCFSCCASGPDTPGACLSTEAAQHAAHAWRTAPLNLNDQKQEHSQILKYKHTKHFRHSFSHRDGWECLRSHLFVLILFYFFTHKQNSSFYLICRIYINLYSIKRIDLCQNDILRLVRAAWSIHTIHLPK